jgi:hypothetical protein
MDELTSKRQDPDTLSVSDETVESVRQLIAESEDVLAQLSAVIEEINDCLATTISANGKVLETCNVERAHGSPKRSRPGRHGEKLWAETLRRCEDIATHSDEIHSILKSRGRADVVRSTTKTFSDHSSAALELREQCVQLQDLSERTIDISRRTGVHKQNLIQACLTSMASPEEAVSSMMKCMLMLHSCQKLPQGAYSRASNMQTPAPSGPGTNTTRLPRADVGARHKRPIQQQYFNRVDRQFKEKFIQDMTQKLQENSDDVTQMIVDKIQELREELQPVLQPTSALSTDESSVRQSLESMTRSVSEWHTAGWENSVLHSVAKDALSELKRYHSARQHELDLLTPKQCLLDFGKYQEPFHQLVLIGIVIKKRLTGARVTYSKDYERIKKERILILRQFKDFTYSQVPQQVVELGTDEPRVSVSHDVSLQVCQDACRELVSDMLTKLLRDRTAFGSEIEAFRTRLEGLISQFETAYKSEEQRLQQCAQSLAFYCGSRSEGLYESKLLHFLPLLVECKSVCAAFAT